MVAMCVSLGLLSGCGSGAVSAPPGPTAPIGITPSTATLFSDLPSTFFVSGGNGNYIAVSSDQNALRVSDTFTGNQLTVVPNAVAADTPVTLTINDTAGSRAASAQLTIKPRTVAIVLTVTPSSTQSASCGTALCAGGDAQVTAVLTQNALPLAQRPVRFEVTSGDVRIITSAVGLPETLDTSTTTSTDNTGTARVRIRALQDAPAQTALLQVTDVQSGFIQRASVTIAGTTGTALAVTPKTITFQGTAAGTCADGISADVIVSGGRPPYQISQPNDFVVTPRIVTASGGRFTVTATGRCATDTLIGVVDAAGATATVDVSNKISDTAVPTFDVQPTTVSLNSCNDLTSVLLVGGTGTYFVAAPSYLAIRITQNTFANGANATIQRTPGSDAPHNASVVISFSDGKTPKPVTVNLSGDAQNKPC